MVSQLLNYPVFFNGSPHPFGIFQFDAPPLLDIDILFCMSSRDNHGGVPEVRVEVRK